jgi:phenylalanyl-tRNA synthetase alpha chain
VTTLEVQLQSLLSTALEEVSSAVSLTELQSIKARYLGKQGSLTALLKSVASAAPELRPQIGAAVNKAKVELETAVQERLSLLGDLLNAKSSSGVDVTLPGRHAGLGHAHPVMRVLYRLYVFFIDLGFEIIEGLEIEDEYYNFTALNIPSSHPARAMHDTFYFADGGLLRTHTSNIQIRTLLKNPPPLRLISAGRVYRRDSDLTHTPMFHQCEGLMVDKHLTFANLKGIIEEFLQHFFEEKLATRWRTSYFPFTEPSAEVDIQCVQCKGQGCRLCKHTGWLEILGCGMVHPQVLRNCKLDPKEYNGFAWGCGLDRLAMLRYGIGDLRTLFENDMRFLEQF